MSMQAEVCAVPGLSLAAIQAYASPPDGAWAVYELISTVERKPPPVTEIEIAIGPAEKIGSRRYRWWQITGKKQSGEHYAVRLLSERVPLAADKAPGTVKRYMLREGDDQPVEYIDSRSDEPLLPKFDFLTGLLPTIEPYLAPTLFRDLAHGNGVGRGKTEIPKRRWGGFASTGAYLGHVIALAGTGAGRAWSEWPTPAVTRLNPDEIHYVYGLARDTEGHYLKEGDYNYVALTPEEIDEMVGLGLNSFTVNDDVEECIRRLPVFYYKQFAQETKLSYPEILYRSTYRGAVAFIDEPEIHILNDRNDTNRMRRPEQGAYTLTKRLEEIWSRPAPGEWRRSLLREQLRANGVNLGTLALNDDDHPIWITMYETAFYQLQGGAAGAVHEGRYRLGEYVADCERCLGTSVNLSAREMLLMHYAFLRGAARAFDKSWGMAIYGQCDPDIAPEAITLAYDMGARYIWLWTYDHQHHLPHFMKLKLLKHLHEHKAKHPRASIDKLLHAPRAAIVLPYGYGYNLSSENLWDSENLHIDSRNDAGVRHREVIAAALAEGIACAKASEDFDYTVDIGQDLKGYTRVVKIGLDAKVTD